MLNVYICTWCCAQCLCILAIVSNLWLLGFFSEVKKPISTWFIAPFGEISYLFSYKNKTDWPGTSYVQSKWQSPWVAMVHAWSSSRSRMITQCACVTSRVDMHSHPWPRSPVSPSLVPQHKSDVHTAPVRPAPNPIPSALFGSLALFSFILLFESSLDLSFRDTWLPC